MDDSLRQYIETQRQAGMPDQDIRQTLVEQGWIEAQLAGAFGEQPVTAAKKAKPNRAVWSIIVITVIIACGLAAYFIFFHEQQPSTETAASGSAGTANTKDFICSESIEWDNTPCTYEENELSDEAIDHMAMEVSQNFKSAGKDDFDSHVLSIYQTEYGNIYIFGCEYDVNYGFLGIPVARAQICMQSSDFKHFYNAHGERIAVCSFDAYINPKICNWLTSLKDEHDSKGVNLVPPYPVAATLNSSNTLISTERGILQMGTAITLPDDFPSGIYVTDGEVRLYFEKYGKGHYFLEIVTGYSIDELKQRYQTELDNDGWDAELNKFMNGDGLEIKAHKTARSDIGMDRNMYVSAQIGSEGTRIFMTLGQSR